MSNKSDFPSLPPTSSSDRANTTIGDTIMIGNRSVPVKHAKKKGSSTSSSNQYSSNKPSSSSTTTTTTNNSYMIGLSDKAIQNLNRINPQFEFSQVLKNNKVLTNCTTCGRVLMAEDGFGPCPFCQTNITPDSVTQYFNSREDYDIPKSKQGNEDYLKALELRNRLLAWDENFSQTTAVIDEQAAEYGQSSTAKDIWLSESEKKEREKTEERIKELKEQLKSKSGQPLRYTFDFSGKRILLDESHKVETQKELDKLVESLKVTQPKNKQPVQEAVLKKEGSSVGMQRSTLLDVSKLKFVETGHKKKVDSLPAANTTTSGRMVVQNQYFVEENDEPPCRHEEDNSGDTIDGLEPEIEFSEPISTHEDDEGWCMSMHQPYCSLLVYGIKRHEGRSWPTDHRGRLWIAATAEEPTQESIDELNTYYRDTFGRSKGYPKHYPTSVIVGCVDVVDCLSYDEYREKMRPEEQESESDYVFICKNPRRLYMPLAISGKPKIYKLTKEQLLSCQLGLKPNK